MAQKNNIKKITLTIALLASFSYSAASFWNPSKESPSNPPKNSEFDASQCEGDILRTQAIDITALVVKTFLNSLKNNDFTHIMQSYNLEEYGGKV